MVIEDKHYNELIDALEFYANPANYGKKLWRELPSQGYNGSKTSVLVSEVEVDEGDLAREVLENQYRRGVKPPPVATVIPLRRV